jgi:hypothetical protein
MESSSGLQTNTWLLFAYDQLKDSSSKESEASEVLNASKKM